MRSPLKIPCATPAWGAWSLWTMSHPSQNVHKAEQTRDRTMTRRVAQNIQQGQSRGRSTRGNESNDSGTLCVSHGIVSSEARRVTPPVVQRTSRATRGYRQTRLWLPSRFFTEQVLADGCCKSSLWVAS